jgi:membrane protein implicated in regulation of membrane protease activity
MSEPSKMAGFVVLIVACLVGGLVATIANGNFWVDALTTFVVTALVAGLGVLVVRRLRPRD